MTQDGWHYRIVDCPSEDTTKTLANWMLKEVYYAEGQPIKYRSVPREEWAEKVGVAMQAVNKRETVVLHENDLKEARL